MKKSIYLLGLLLLVACANDDEPTGQQVQNTYPLTIEVTENPLIPDGEEGSSTRAAIVTTSSFDKFYLNYKYDDYYPNDEQDKQTITKTSEIWSGGGWPNDARTAPDTKVAWYAYTAGTFNWTEGNPKNPYVHFTVEELATNQKDLLVAKLTNKTWNNCGGNLNFTFDHACAALRFLVKKAKNLDDYTLSISPSNEISIKLFNVVKEGKYYFDKTPSWELVNNGSSYTLYSGSFNNLSSDEYTELTQGTGPYLFIIPQILTAWNHSGNPANTYIELNCSISKSEFSYSGKAYIPFGATLEAGKKYDVKINIGMNSLYKVENNTASLIIPQNS